ncbi:NAD-dependent epimerase/dehydratase family protein [Streptomyces sp. NPDC060002]|uniref:NAD-dependent epimerase/dehydratase family protein n=1 Tax=Streptomyces sp. NPDC060002 TaxID=3347033 RepID=UPI0036AE0668
MRILVTGEGFVGSEFVRSVLSADSESRITVLDNFTYSGVEGSLALVAHHPGYACVRGDICDVEAVDAVMPGHDAVAHEPPF